MKFILFVLFLINIVKADDLVEFDYELDAYYTNVSAFIALEKDANITDATQFSEAQIYRSLVFNTLRPNIFLVEAAINPMGIGGLYIKDKHSAYYDQSHIRKVNLIQAITAGFEEPDSLSFFVGRMMVFKKKNSSYIGKNRAYMGYLLTIGDYTIKDNIAYYDKWYNVEFKLKGTRELELSDLDWSFRVGATVHENSNFVDTYYFGARRSSIDFTKRIMSLIYNSDFNAMVAISSDSFLFTEGRISIGKSFPIQWPAKVSLGIELGYLYYSQEKYRGALREEGIENHQLIFHPNIKW